MTTLISSAELLYFHNDRTDNQHTITPTAGESLRDAAQRVATQHGHGALVWEDVLGEEDAEPGVTVQARTPDGVYCIAERPRRSALPLREQLRDDNTAEFAAERLAETNYPLLLQAAREDRALMSELCYADVIDYVAGYWEEDLEGAKAVLLAALRDPEAVVQERALKGLMKYHIVGDVEVRSFLDALDIRSLDVHVHRMARNLLSRPE